MDDRIRSKLVYVYGRNVGLATTRRLESLIDSWRRKLPEIPGSPDGGVPADERDAIMITYGDNVQAPGEVPLDTLGRFASERLEGVVEIGRASCRERV